MAIKDNPRKIGRAQQQFCDGLLRVGTYSILAVSIILFYQFLNNQLVSTLILYLMPAYAAVTGLLLYRRSNYEIKSQWLVTILFTISISVLINRGLFSLGPVIGLISIVTAAVLLSRNLLFWVSAGQTCAVWGSWFVHIYHPEFYNFDMRFLESNLVLSRAFVITGIYITFALALEKLVINLALEAEDTARLKQHAVQSDMDITSLLGFANAPIFSIDLQGCIKEWNHALETITGFSREHALGKDLVEEFTPEDAKESLANILQNTLQGLESNSFQTALKSINQMRVEILLNTSCRRNSKGQVLGVLCVGQDVTDMRQQEDMLIRSQKLDSIGQLTGGIAHDFNNLLTIIQGNLDLLRDRFKGSPGDTKEILDDVHAAALHGAGLTSQLLSFAGKSNLLVKKAEINTVIKNSSRMIARTLDDSISISLQLSEKPLFALVDASLLESALINLSLNSRDAMQERQGSLLFSSYTEKIESTRADLLDLDSGEYIVISLKDDGKGIEPENITRVIEPFFTTKNRSKASGLGLSMVHGFARQSNGALDIQSEREKGTTVMIMIPLLSDDAIKPK